MGRWGWTPQSRSHFRCLCLALSYEQRAGHLQARVISIKNEADMLCQGRLKISCTWAPWKLDNCPSVSLYVPFIAAYSVLLPHMCFFIGCKLENIVKSFGFRATLKWSQFNFSILKWEFFPWFFNDQKVLSCQNHKMGYMLKKGPTFWRDRLWVSELPTTGHKMSFISISCPKLRGVLLPNLSKSV